MTNKKKGEVERIGEFIGDGVKQGWGAVKKIWKRCKRRRFRKKEIEIIVCRWRNEIVGYIRLYNSVLS